MTTQTAASAKTSKTDAEAGGQGVPGLDPHQPVATDRWLLAWMLSFLKPVRWVVVVTLLYVAALVGLEVVTVKYVGEATNRINSLQSAPRVMGIGFWEWISSTEPQASDLRRVVLLLIGLVVLSSILRYLREVSQMRMSMEQAYYLREAVYEKLQRVGFGFHDAMSTGQLINRALTDLNNVRGFNQTAILTSFEILLAVTGYILLLMSKNPWVAGLALLPTPIWVWYILRFNKKVQPVAKAVMEAGDKNVSIVTENIAGVHVVKAFETEAQEIRKYNLNTREFFRRVRDRIKLWANFHPMIHGIAAAAQVVLSLAVAIMVIRGQMQVGDFLILGAAMGAILGRLQMVASINESYQNAIVSARRLYEVMMARQTVPEKPGAPELPEGTGRVKFDRVTFGYDPQKPVVMDINIDVPGGSVVAICGPTGAGKSTLVNLIARFYDPTSGRVLIDGVDVRDVTLNSLRTEVAFVFQETYLFSDTVEANIAYGRPGISGGEVEAAARLAQAHDFIQDLPAGYQTVLAERGSSLSGGQRQRLAIARAIVQNPRILVLDDATAAVDPETEDLIRRGMKFVMRGRTTFVIAHRLSTVRQADLVLVIEHGRVQQAGTHDELMQEEGHYRQIAAVQLYGDGEEPEKPSHMDRVGRPGAVARNPGPRSAETAGEPKPGPVDEVRAVPATE